MAALYADDDESEDDQSLKITSETAMVSAQCFIDNGDVDEDKKRTKIGIGEQITLTVSGKNMGDISQLKWTITQGEDRAYIEGSDEGEVSIEVIGDENVMKQSDGNTTIQVTTSEGETAAIDLEIVAPEGIEGEHLDGGTPSEASAANGVIASMWVKCTYYPLDVNFSKISLIERDGGSLPAGMTMDMGHKGNGADVIYQPNYENSSEDKVYYGVLDEAIDNGTYRLPQEWSWICHYYVHTGTGGPDSEGSDRCFIETIWQNMSFQQDHPENPKSNYKATVSKFSCEVSASRDDRTQTFN